MFYPVCHKRLKEKSVEAQKLALNNVTIRNQIQVKFIYSEKAKKFCEISTLLLSLCTVDKSKVEISQNFVAFSEYMNFNKKNKVRDHNVVFFTSFMPHRQQKMT